MERSNTPTREERVQWLKSARKIYTERSRAQQPHRNDGHRRCASQSPRHRERTPVKPAGTPTRRNLNIFARSDEALDLNLTFSKGKPVEAKNLFELDPNNPEEFRRMMQILDKVQELKFRPFQESAENKSLEEMNVFEKTGLRIEALSVQKSLSQSILRLRKLPSQHQRSVLLGVDAANLEWFKNNIKSL